MFEKLHNCWAVLWEQIAIPVLICQLVHSSSVDGFALSRYLENLEKAIQSYSIQNISIVFWKLQNFAKKSGTKKILILMDSRDRKPNTKISYRCPARHMVATCW